MHVFRFLYRFVMVNVVHVNSKGWSEYLNEQADAI